MFFGFLKPKFSADELVLMGHLSYEQIFILLSRDYHLQICHFFKSFKTSFFLTGLRRLEKNTGSHTRCFAL